MPNRVDGGPAFAKPGYWHGDEREHGDQEGMSLRDYFAGQVLTGVFAGQSVVLPFMERYEKAPAATAELAYRFADAMLVARKT